jgi:hypothetical protein
LIIISEEARTYGLWELCRRAGVTNEFFQSWKIVASVEGDLVIQPQPASGEIHFPRSRAGVQADQAVSKTWFGGAPVRLREVVPDFVVPFCTSASIAGQPLFVEDAPQKFTCTEDILASIVLTLCRFEEIDSPVCDAHGRFPASASMATRHNYLHRPIVDEYGLALQQVLEALLPGWRPLPRRPRVKLTHDVDEVGIPFRFRSAVGHILKRRAPLCCARDFLSLGTSVEPTYLKLVRNICEISMERNLHSTLYWMATPPGSFDFRYDLTDSRIARVIAWARDRGIEMGVHPGYNTFLSPSLLEQEVQRCRKALQSEHIGGRQHFLRWRPETWLHWERCGLLYDTTVAFGDRVGFRAGTCVPYLPWLWKENRRADLLEIPLLVMEVTLLGADYMALEPDQVEGVVKQLLRRCSIVGGVFTVIWHNTSLLRPFSRHYRMILDILGGASDYDWQSDLAQLRLLSRTLPCYNFSSTTNRARPAMSQPTSVSVT